LQCTAKPMTAISISVQRSRAGKTAPRLAALSKNKQSKWTKTFIGRQLYKLLRSVQKKTLLGFMMTQQTKFWPFSTLEVRILLCLSATTKLSWGNYGSNLTKSSTTLRRESHLLIASWLVRSPSCTLVSTADGLKWSPKIISGMSMERAELAFSWLLSTSTISLSSVRQLSPVTTPTMISMSRPSLSHP